MLTKFVNTTRDWHLHLPLALWAYRTSFRMTTGATPFSLVFGSEGVLPFEIAIPSLRVAQQKLLSDDHLLQNLIIRLKFLDGNWLHALQNLRTYQQRL